MNCITSDFLNFLKIVEAPHFYNKEFLNHSRAVLINKIK